MWGASAEGMASDRTGAPCVVAEPSKGEGIELEVVDDGPGIRDVSLALSDGFSTSGGMGSGLPGARRLMSELTVSSSEGGGTVVKAVKWSSRPPPPDDPIR